MKLLIFVFIAAVFSLVSCDELTDSFVFRYGEETDLKQHIEYVSEDNQLKIEIKKITDSRCPTGVVCVWQGEAKVTLQAVTGTNIPVGSITLSTNNNLTDTIGSTWSVRLLDVKPYPVYQQPVDSNNVVTTVVIKKIKS